MKEKTQYFMIISTSAALIETALLRLSRSLYWGCLNSLHWGCLNSLHWGCRNSLQFGCLNSLHWGCLNNLHWGCLNSLHWGCPNSLHWGCLNSLNWGCLNSHFIKNPSLRLPQDAFNELRLPQCTFIGPASKSLGCLKKYLLRLPQNPSLRMILLSIKALTS